MTFEACVLPLTFGGHRYTMTAQTVLQPTFLQDPGPDETSIRASLGPYVDRVSRGSESEGGTTGEQ